MSSLPFDSNVRRAAMEKTPAEEEKQSTDDNLQTIRPMRSPPGGTAPLPVAKPPSKFAPIVEDFSDLDFADDDDKLEEKVAGFRVKKLSRYNLDHNLIP